jgi:HEPN domain-containing protein
MNGETNVDYKQVALDRFCDALALYKTERYSASFYMAGYVIEIGVKYKFVELGKTVPEKVSLNVISYLLTGTKKTKIPDFKEVANIASKFNKKAPQDLSHIKMVTLQRTPPGGTENRFHDTHSFIEGLFHWYEVFEHQDADSLKKFIYTGNFKKFYGISNEKTVWSTDLRYEPSDNKDENKAKEQLDLCFAFLRDILGYTDEEIKKHLVVTKLN